LNDHVQRLVAEADAVGVPLQAPAAARLLSLLALVRAAPFNLTALRDPDEMRRKHVVDSLACLPAARLAPGEVVLDLGSGAGFPGLPLAVVRPDIRLTLLEASAKKVAFLQVATARLELANVEAVHGRAEDLGRDGRWRERFDAVVARAVAPLPVLAEYALPLCRVGGRLVALKGARGDEELAQAGQALERLGAGPVARHAFSLPGGGDTRLVLVIQKARPTPGAYPRRAGVPSQRPL
jgi:16S rRNA (guanine527-N7)-methyltransferase